MFQIVFSSHYIKTTKKDAVIECQFFVNERTLLLSFWFMEIFAFELPDKFFSNLKPTITYNSFKQKWKRVYKKWNLGMETKWLKCVRQHYVWYVQLRLIYRIILSRLRWCRCCKGCFSDVLLYCYSVAGRGIDDLEIGVEGEEKMTRQIERIDRCCWLGNG